MRYRYRTDDEMKDSGVEWLGKIPREWERTKIKYTADIFGRIGFRGYTVDDLVEEGEGAITLSPSNIINQKLDLSKRTYISWNKYEESPEIKIFNNDVLLVKTASVGKVAYVENLSEEATINPQFVVFKNINMDNKLFYYFQRSEILQNQIRSDLFGGVVSTLTQERIKNYYICNINEKEQQKIASFLDKKTAEFDTIIEKKQSLITKLTEAKKSLISEVVTGKKEVQVIGNKYQVISRNEEEMKDSGVEWLGKIPKEWEVKRLKNVSKLTMGQSPDSESIIEDNNGMPFYQGKTEFGKLYPIPKNYCNAPKKIANLEEILISVRAPVGDLNLTNSICCIGRGLASIESKINKMFLFYLLNIAKKELVSYATGSTFEAISTEQLKNIKISTTSNQEQQKIASFLDEKTAKIDSTIEKINLQIEKLKEAKQSLISEAVTGKIEVL